MGTIEDLFLILCMRGDSTFWKYVKGTIRGFWVIMYVVPPSIWGMAEQKFKVQPASS